MAGFIAAGLGAGLLGAGVQAYGMHQQSQNAKKFGQYLDQNPYDANFGAYQNPYERQRYQQMGGQQQAGMQRAAMAGAPWEGRQNELANSLQARIAGQRPSVAELQMRQAQQAGMAQSQSMLAGSRGVNPALAFRNAQLANAQLQGSVAGQGAMLRAQEQMNAEQQYGQLSTNARQQSMQQAAMANDLDFNYLRQAVGMDENKRNAGIMAERDRYNQYLNQLQARQTAMQMNNQNQGNMYNAASGGLAALGGGLLQAGASQMNQPQQSPFQGYQTQYSSNGVPSAGRLV